MPGQRVLFMGWIKRSKSGEKIENEASHLILWMKDEKQGAKKSFYLAAFRMPRERSTRSFSKCRLKHWCKRVIMIPANFREKYITLKLGGMCWHHFLTHVKERWFLWREGSRFGRNQKMHRVVIGRWSPSDGPGEYAVKMLICPFWCSADGEMPMKLRKEERIRTLRESWWFSCNI